MFLSCSQSTMHNRRETTKELTRGVCRLFENLGFATLKEFKLPNRRRVDVIAMNPNGNFSIIEVKSSVGDYKTDNKWLEYLPYCQRFYFAVPYNFPTKIIPRECGIIVADAFEATIRKESFHSKINSTRHRHQLIRLGYVAGSRINQNDLASIKSSHIR